MSGPVDRVESVELVNGAVSPGGVELVEPREVPLGGPRAMTVRRTLPARSRSLVGAFCFADHFGPDDISVSGGMDVAPHPHTGLQTVTWLFEGTVLHQDALGSVQTIAPGQLNVMTAGAGICHSEEGTLKRFPQQRTLHGVQLWTVMPEDSRHGPRDFEHVAELPETTLGGARIRVVLGSLLGLTSPARTYSPLVAAQIDLPAGHSVEIPVDESFEHGLLVDRGAPHFEDVVLDTAWLGYTAPGRSTLRLTAGDEDARAVLLGGEPFEEDIVMWWNFVGRSHEEIVESRRLWQDAIAGGAEGIERFGVSRGYDGKPWPAPELPDVRLKPRPRPKR